jgi:hypothetical protein
MSDEWLASLEDPKSREVIYFKNMDEMFDYLRAIKTNCEMVDSN